MKCIDDAQPGDIYADGEGKLWRIMHVVREPMVSAEAVEGTLYDPANQNPALLASACTQLSNTWGPLKAEIVKDKRAGHMDSGIWHSFRRIWREGE